MSKDPRTQAILNELNKLMGEHLPRNPRYRYYEDAKRNHYFWTTERAPCGHGNDKHFMAGIYKYHKSKREWKLSRTRCFAKRYKAKEWAHDQLLKAKEIEAARLQERAEKGKAVV